MRAGPAATVDEGGSTEAMTRADDLGDIIDSLRYGRVCPLGSSVEDLTVGVEVLDDRPAVGLEEATLNDEN